MRPEFDKQVDRAKPRVDQANAQVKPGRGRIVTAKADRDAAAAFVEAGRSRSRRADRRSQVSREAVRSHQRPVRTEVAIDERLVDEKLDEMEALVAAERPPRPAC